MGIRNQSWEARRDGGDRVFTFGFSLYARLFSKIQNQQSTDNWNGILREGVLGFG